MEQRRKAGGTQRTGPLPLILAAAAVLVLTLLVVTRRPGGSRDAVPQAQLDEGLAYLNALEERDPAAIDQLIKQRRAERLAREREELLRQLYAGETNVWTMFQDYILLGDSRAVGFSYYNFLDPSRVLAESGDTIRSVDAHLDELAAQNPAFVYLCYGINDLIIGFWPTPEDYAEEMLDVVMSIREQVPDATVVISSILPARDPAFQRSAKWREIPEYNAAVEKMCREHGIAFCSNDQAAADHAKLWEPDGIHLRSSFYSYWGSNLIIAALEAQQLEEEDGP